MKAIPTVFAVLALLAMGEMAHAADTIIWIDDNSGHVGQVDVTTQSVVSGSVVTVNNPGFDLSGGLSDIAFTSSGTLYGSTFTNLFSVNTATGAAINLGSFGNGESINALVGNGSTLLGAGFPTASVYSIDPAAPAALTVVASAPAESAGDLAFVGATLYESGVSASGADELIDVASDSVVGLFHVGTSSGALLGNVLGLADDGTTLYAAAGTEIYRVNATNGVLTPLFDYSGHGLTSARGSAFPNEASNPTSPVSEPSPYALMGMGLAAIGLLMRRKLT